MDQERFIIYDTKNEREAFRMTESEIRIWLAIHEKESLIKELFDDYKPLEQD